MKINIKHLVVFLILFVICFQNEAVAQPRCNSNVNFFESCNSAYLNLEYVFVGRVISLGVPPEDTPKSLTIPRKIIVDVETPLKGNLNKHARIELFLDQQCETNVEVNGKHVFTAESIISKKFTGLFSGKWSKELQEYSPKELKEYLIRIREQIKIIKQPRLVGKVMQFFVKKTSFLIGSDPLTEKLGYNPQFSKPLSKIIIVAKFKTGKMFETKTNNQGEYEFKNLPNGEYEVFANLPKEFTVVSNGDFTKIEGEKKYVLIDDGICSKKINFSIQVLGSLKGRIMNITRRWVFQPIVYLIRVDPKSGRNDIFESDFYEPSGMSILDNSSEIVADFSIDGIPIGQYLVYIRPSSNGLEIYYPGVKDRNKAKIIEVKVGKPNNFVFSIE